MPALPLLPVAPELAIEVLSPSNTPGEMNRKLREYFLGGVLRVWYIDPVQRLVRDFRSPDDVLQLTEEQTLRGDDILPGFQLPLSQVFVRTVGPEAQPKPSQKKTPKTPRKKKQ